MNRVAVIEVGSRAVRLLVADVLPDGKLQVVGTDWKETGLAEALDAGGLETEAKMAEVADTVRRFCVRATEFQAQQIAAFGTAAIRKLGAKGKKFFRKTCPDFQVLKPKEEGELSFLTAIMGVSQEALGQQPALVIDQGSGSMEVIVGNMTQEGPHVRYSKSYKLGTRELVKLLQQNEGSLPGLRKALATIFLKSPILASHSKSPTIILGSAATKLAWLPVRGRQVTLPYDPRKVHGRIVRLRDIDHLVQLTENNSALAREFIDPKHPESAELETIVSGLIAIEEFLKRQGKEDFIVCAHGTRFGYAWKMALANRTA